MSYALNLQLRDLLEKSVRDAAFTISETLAVRLTLHMAITS
jgi:hypothetical protein